MLVRPRLGAARCPHETKTLTPRPRALHTNPNLPKSPMISCHRIPGQLQVQTADLKSTSAWELGAVGPSGAQA